MIKNPTFYSVIIGTELLNGRREDSHFSFFNKELVKRGWEHKANFVIKDDPTFLKEVFKLVKSDPNSVMFSFGGIGSTPDDFTREIASISFTSEYPVRHKEAEEIIIERLGEKAYPHPIKMADIPRNSKLIFNPVNNMPGFQLEDRFFFVPGFPQMAHPMISSVLEEFYPKNSEKYSCSFIAYCSEARMIDIMEALSDEVEFSCLPSFDGEKRSAEIYLAAFDKELLELQCAFFKEKLEIMGIEYATI